MTDESGLELEQVQHEGADVVRVTGEVDLTNVDRLQAALLATTSARVILDLTGLYFLDSAGIRAVDEAHRALVGEQRTLRLVAPPDSRAAWTFRVAGFRGSFVFESVEAAAKDNASPSANR